jgi:rhodanese-related sulfurtransferase
MVKLVDAKTVKTWLSDGGEVAFCDVREQGPFADGHAFFAVPLPYSRLELDIERLLPNRSVRLVLTDAGDGVAERAARRAAALGYSNIFVLEGGAPGWKAAGYTLYEGVNVPSKTFGELVEIERHTPRVTAQELAAMQARGDDMVIVDGRTWAEYQRFNIPGGICCPNGELALRIASIVPDPKTMIVVNCAGRTRSIIGAQTLIDLGVPNPVVALENGTQGWFLAGFEVERGADRRWPEPPADPADLERLRAKVRAHAARTGVPFVSAGEVAGWLAEPERTTYLLDVRTAEEVAASPLPGFAHAPGGQLVQATDQWVGVRGARLVLADSEFVRAPMVAAWLRQLGHDASVLDTQADALTAIFTARGTGSARADAVLPKLPEATAEEVASLRTTAGAAVVDLRASAAYREGHIRGSVWSIRPRLAAASVRPSQRVVLIADDVRIARAAALDLAERGAGDMALLAGGIAAWRSAGLPVEITPDKPADPERIDFVFHTHGRHDGSAAAARAYLVWEIGLVGQLDAQERGAFRIAG